MSQPAFRDLSSRNLGQASPLELGYTAVESDNGPSQENGAKRVSLVDDLHASSRSIGFGELAGRIAQGPEEQHDEDALRRLLEVMTVDAWDECEFKFAPFVLTYFYEVLPSLVAQFLCCAFEGKLASVNRMLMYPQGLVADIIFRTQWACIILFLLYSPPCVSLLNIIVVFLMLSFRAGAIAMKYAYFPTSDLRIVQGMSEWRDARHVFRTLGAGSHFNVAGTFYFDVMKEILLASLRANVMEELPKRKLALHPKMAAIVWNDVKTKLANNDDFEALEKSGLSPSHLRGSKFGDIQKLIGLSDIRAIDAEISQGYLRVSVVTYYFATKGYAPTANGPQVVGVIALVVTGAVAGGRHLCLDTTDATIATVVLLSMQTLCFLTNILTVILYMLFPILDAWKRWELGECVLSAFGHQQIRAQRIKRGCEDVRIPLNTVEDMFAFWVMQRVLGPELYRGQAIRYNCAYLVVSFFHLLAMLATIAFLDTSDQPVGVVWGAAIEVMVPFCILLFGLCCATLIAERANTTVDTTKKIIKRSALNSLLENSSATNELDDVAEVLIANFEEVPPVQIIYMPATTEVLWVIWTVLAYLSDLMRRQLQNKLFHTD